jgi:hypothetical protein
MYLTICKCLSLRIPGNKFFIIVAERVVYVGSGGYV